MIKKNYRATRILCADSRILTYRYSRSVKPVSQKLYDDVLRRTLSSKGEDHLSTNVTKRRFILIREVETVLRIFPLAKSLVIPPFFFYVRAIYATGLSNRRRTHVASRGYPRSRVIATRLSSSRAPDYYSSPFARGFASRSRRTSEGAPSLPSFFFGRAEIK